MIEEDLGGSIGVETRSHVRVGHPGVEIMDVASGTDDEELATLVVLGSRGLGGFRGLLLGSVTTYAVHHLEAPVLIVPAYSPDGVGTTGSAHVDAEAPVEA